MLYSLLTDLVVSSFLNI